MLQLTRTNIAKETEKRIIATMIFVGIDVHQKQWNVTVLCEGRVIIKGKTMPPDPKALLEYLKKKVDFEEIIIAYEAGFCGFWIQREFTKLGVKAIVVNPADVPTTDKDSKQKTDRRDSYKIAEGLKAGMLKPIYVPTVNEEEKQSLLRRRSDLVQKQTRIKVQIKSFIMKHGIELSDKNDTGKWSENYINQIAEYAKKNRGLGYQLESMLSELSFFKKEKKSVEIAIAELANSKEYKRDYQNLMTIPGIAKIVAASIIFELYNIDRFTSFSQFASYMGIIPTEFSSGEKQRRGRMTKRGKTKLKSLIIESTWVAISKDEDFKKYYYSLLSRMKPQKAIISCARKLLSRIYHILKEHEEYKYKVAS
jgi:transposase